MFYICNREILFRHPLLNIKMDCKPQGGLIIMFSQVIGVIKDQ